MKKLCFISILLSVGILYAEERGFVGFGFGLHNLSETKTVQGEETGYGLTSFGVLLTGSWKPDKVNIGFVYRIGMFIPFSASQLVNGSRDNIDTNSLVARFGSEFFFAPAYFIEAEKKVDVVLGIGPHFTWFIIGTKDSVFIYPHSYEVSYTESSFWLGLGCCVKILSRFSDRVAFEAGLNAGYDFFNATSITSTFGDSSSSGEGSQWSFSPYIAISFKVGKTK